MSGRSQSPLVVVVEDDAAVLNSLEFMLAAAGYRVLACADPAEAEAADGVAKASCLIIDYGLPDIDGLTLLHRLRQRGVSAPAVLIASTPSGQCRQAAREAGIPLFEKPLDGGSLSGWVAQMTSRRGFDADQRLAGSDAET